MGMDFNDDELQKAIEKYAKECEQKIGQYCKTSSQRLETYAKVHRPWTDRTGRARAGLSGTSRKQPNQYEWKITLSHSVDYGVFLELAHEKKWAIIMPTINEMSPKIMEGFEGLLDGMKL